MNPNETPPKQAATPTPAEIERQQKQARLAGAITPQGSGYSGARARYEQPINHPLQPCNFTKWCRLDSLPIEQACFVLLGYEPPPLPVLLHTEDPYDTSGNVGLTWEAPSEYADVLSVLKNSIANRRVSAQSIREHPFQTKQVLWPALIQWAKEKRYQIPTELEAMAANTSPAQTAATPAPVSVSVKVPAPYLSVDFIARAISAAEVSRSLPDNLREQRASLTKVAADWQTRLPPLLKAGKLTPRTVGRLEPVGWKNFDTVNHVFHVDDLNACQKLADEGLSFEVVQDSKQQQEDVATLREHVFNGRLIDWDYWLRRMPTLSAAEAARLMAGLDPELYADLEARPLLHNDPSNLCGLAAKFERTATAEGLARKTPREWLMWARQHAFGIHQAFVAEVNELPAAAEQLEELARLPPEEAAHWHGAPLYPGSEGVRLVTYRYCDGLSKSDRTMSLGDFLWTTAERLDLWRSGQYTTMEAGGTYLDTRAAQAAGRSDTALEPVEVINRAKKRSGQGGSGA